MKPFALGAVLRYRQQLEDANKLNAALSKDLEQARGDLVCVVQRSSSRCLKLLCGIREPMVITPVPSFICSITSFFEPRAELGNSCSSPSPLVFSLKTRAHSLAARSSGSPGLFS